MEKRLLRGVFFLILSVPLSIALIIQMFFVSTIYWVVKGKEYQLHNTWLDKFVDMANKLVNTPIIDKQGTK